MSHTPPPSPSTDTRAALAQALQDRYGHAVHIPDDISGLEALLRQASRSTHRSWSRQPVPPDLVTLLAACAFAAPSKSFLQQADLIDVRDLQRRAALHALVPQMPWMADAPALLVFCANGRRFKRLFDRRDMAFANDHLDSFFNAVVDASILMQAFLDAAEAIGLVACPISMIRNQPEQLAQILELPERVVPVVGLCLGYPDQPRQPVPRLGLAATLHRDGMAHCDDDTLIDDFDQRLAARKAVLPAGSATPSTWSDERVRQYAMPQRADWGAFVRRQGFELD